jgi:predicted phosphodiesterase
MRIAVISDLHLGPGDETERFGHDDHEFVRFLRFLEQDHQEIVLLGDVYEALMPRRRGAAAAEMVRCRAAHQEITRRFDQPNYRYIHGNHDLVARQVLGAPAEHLLEADGVRVLFTHGHHHDWLVRRAPLTAELLVWAGGWLRRWGLASWHLFFDRFDQWWSTASLRTKPAFERWAIGMARERKADVVVTGHTHTGARSGHGDALYLNSGACTDGRINWLSLDTATLDFRYQVGW